MRKTKSEPSDNIVASYAIYDFSPFGSLTFTVKVYIESLLVHFKSDYRLSTTVISNVDTFPLSETAPIVAVP